MSNRDIALKFLESFSSGHPNAVVSHVSEDFQNNQISILGDNCTGREAYRKRLVGFLSGFHNLRYQPNKIIAEENDVAIAYTMNFEENERPIEIQGVMILTMENDLISVRTDYWDGLSYLRQTGIDYTDP
jgi:predicted ester cyclase